MWYNKQQKLYGVEAQGKLDYTFREMRYIGEHVYSLIHNEVVFLDGLVLIFIGAVSWQNGVLVIPLHRCRSGKQVNITLCMYTCGLKTPYFTCNCSCNL